MKRPCPVERSRPPRLCILGVGMVLTMLGFGSSGWVLRVGLVIAVIGGITTAVRMPGLVNR
ncbi:hypothetical protein [Enhygromyxa salina]|nr:hypothetical protein [Enhygromyxa salina]